MPLGGSHFTGREELLKALKTSLATSAKATVITSKQAIHGMRGVGKTRVAIQYAHDNKSDYSALLFVIAETSDILKAKLAGLCEVLDLPERQVTDQDVQLNAC